MSALTTWAVDQGATTGLLAASADGAGLYTVARVGTGAGDVVAHGRRRRLMAMVATMTHRTKSTNGMKRNAVSPTRTASG